jgi:hypothetical protein
MERNLLVHCAILKEGQCEERRISYGNRDIRRAHAKGLLSNLYCSKGNERPLV